MGLINIVYGLARDFRGYGYKASREKLM